MGFPDGSDGKESACHSGTWIRSLGREDDIGEGNGNPLQDSCMGNPRKRSLEGDSLWGHKRVRHDLATKQQQRQYLGIFTEVEKLIYTDPYTLRPHEPSAHPACSFSNSHNLSFPAATLESPGERMQLSRSHLYEFASKHCPSKAPQTAEVCSLTVWRLEDQGSGGEVGSFKGHDREPVPGPSAASGGLWYVVSFGLRRRLPNLCLSGLVSLSLRTFL